MNLIKFCYSNLKTIMKTSSLIVNSSIDIICKFRSNYLEVGNN